MPLLFSDLSVCLLIFSLSFFNSTTDEQSSSGHIFACRTRGARSDMYYARLLRGVAAPKGLRRDRSSHRRRGILDSDRVGCISSVGVAAWRLQLVITLLFLGDRCTESANYICAVVHTRRESTAVERKRVWRKPRIDPVRVQDITGWTKRTEHINGLELFLKIAIT
jgi:hypothetical protein